MSKRKKPHTNNWSIVGCVLVSAGILVSWIATTQYMGTPDECEETDEWGTIAHPDKCIAEKSAMNSAGQAFEQLSLVFVLAGIGFILFGKR
jgi:hypothetical protein